MRFDLQLGAGRGTRLRGWCTALCMLAVLACAASRSNAMTALQLPEPEIHSHASLGEALRQRRSVRAYSGRSLTLQQIGQLLWAAQGHNDPSGLRTAPSAGALYPLELLLVAGNVTGLDQGVYRYRPKQHALEMLRGDDRRVPLARAALGQGWVADSAAVLVITAIYERTARKYGVRGKRYVHIEVGHAAQNALLQAASLGLGAAVVGAFDDAAVARLLDVPASEHVLYLLPVGWPADSR
jgi:SagB-type dehydrogenase family enzyme